MRALPTLLGAAPGGMFITMNKKSVHCSLGMLCVYVCVCAYVNADHIACLLTLKQLQGEASRRVSGRSVCACCDSRMCCLHCSLYLNITRWMFYSLYVALLACYMFVGEQYLFCVVGA